MPPPAGQNQLYGLTVQFFRIFKGFATSAQVR